MRSVPMEEAAAVVAETSGSTQKLESEKRKDRRRRLAGVVAHAEGSKGIQAGSERAEVLVEHRRGRRRRRR